VVVPTAKGEEAFQLFKKCKIEKEDNGEWYIEFDAHDDALPLMFEFKKEYVTYKVINVLRLKGENHIRMYEILKQYEGLREITIPLEELRKRLGVKPEEYPRWERFKSKVLDECRKALEEHTDIKYIYEPIKRGGGKTSPVKAVKFFITQNTKAEQLSLFDEEVVGKAPIQEPHPYEKYSDPTTIAIANAFDFRFDESEMKLIEQAIKESPNAPKELEMRINFCKRMNAELNYRISKKEKDGDPVKNEFAFALTVIKTQLKEGENT
jgi:plasmid replication initiation protein